MNITTLQELSDLIDLCKKKSVYSIIAGDVTLNITPDAVEAKQEERKVSYTDPLTGLPLSDEELEFYSSSGGR